MWWENIFYEESAVYNVEVPYIKSRIPQKNVFKTSTTILQLKCYTRAIKGRKQVEKIIKKIKGKIMKGYVIDHEFRHEKKEEKV